MHKSIVCDKCSYFIPDKRGKSGECHESPPVAVPVHKVWPESGNEYTDIETHWPWISDAKNQPGCGKFIELDVIATKARAKMP